MSSLRTSHDKTLIELENYKLLVENVEDYAIFLLDPKGVIISWNKGAERNKGYKDYEIIGKHFSTFYTQHDIDAKKPETELEIAQRLGRIEDEDWRVRKDGSRFWANVIITALRNPEGKLVGFAKVTRDLTERKQQEDDLRKANTQLRKQQEQLQRLNDSKDEFISMASHQLRTPATIVKQLLGILLAGYSDELTPSQRDIIQKAQDSNERQISTVNGLLDVAQIDAGKIVLKKTAVDIQKMISDIIDEQSKIIGERKQSIQVQVDSNIPDVFLDQKYFRMVLENLIDNASKYTYELGIIMVSLEADDEALIIRINDSGVGIAEADIATLFTKFNRIPNELSASVTGTGLGLYWVQKVVELHGGKISVESQLQKGSSFIIKMPIGK